MSRRTYGWVSGRLKTGRKGILAALGTEVSVNVHERYGACVIVHNRDGTWAAMFLDHEGYVLAVEHGDTQRECDTRLRARGLYGPALPAENPLSKVD